MGSKEENYGVKKSQWQETIWDSESLQTWMESSTFCTKSNNSLLLR